MYTYIMWYSTLYYDKKNDQVVQQIFYESYDYPPPSTPRKPIHNYGVLSSRKNQCNVIEHIREEVLLESNDYGADEHIILNDIEGHMDNQETTNILSHALISMGLTQLEYDIKVDEVFDFIQTNIFIRYLDVQKKNVKGEKN